VGNGVAKKRHKIPIYSDQIILIEYSEINYNVKKKTIASKTLESTLFLQLERLHGAKQQKEKK
jgi:hypothetical protein